MISYRLSTQHQCFWVLFLLFFSTNLWAQTKVGGVVYNKDGVTVPFANVVFPGSYEGTITNDDGRFYLQSAKTYDQIEISFVGYKTKTIDLDSRVKLDFKIVLEDDQSQLDAVVVYAGKTSKKDNPALDILRKVWENRRKNGLSQFNQYQYEKYEKLEFDLNTIDSALINSNIFSGMEFIFDYADTSAVTGKTYLPIFINESLSTVYGDNTLNQEKENVKANKNSGFSDNQVLISFVKDLYTDIDVYERYLKFFDKSFVSPVGKSGIDTYNYVLRDTAVVDGLRSFNIVYYPRRKGELTFKGDFWVADSTYAIKEIKMQATKSANINWVKDIYIEQEYQVLDDSLFLITRDYFMSDFALNKDEESRGVYGKRTTLFDQYQFDIKKPDDFYRRRVNDYDPEIYSRSEAYWDENRLEKLNKDEKQVYVMLDTLKQNKKFARLYNYGIILGTGYYEVNNFDIGPLFSVLGFNDVEGFRFRVGGRTYFTANDPWRLEGYAAYGLRDDQFKYGISGKYLLDKKSRLTLSAGSRRDIEQLAASLTNTNNVLGRSLASSALISTGNNGRLSSINLSTLSLSIEPLYNLEFRVGGTYKTIKSANPGFFSMDFLSRDPLSIESEVTQTDVSFTTTYTPGRKTANYGVDRTVINETQYPILYVNYTRGVKGLINSDFEYDRVQFYYSHPLLVGGLGRLNARVEAGKTFGTVPLALLDVIPGNQTYFNLPGAFNTMDFYEFVTDQYVTLHLDHNFNGRIFSRIPGLQQLDLRELLGFKAVYGTISENNIAINRSNVEYRAPEDIYYEYSFGIGNIFRILRLDMSFRGNYNSLPDARNVALTASLGFSF